MGKQLPGSKVAVLGTGREAVLRRKAIVHRHHRVAGQPRHVSADLVIGVDIAGDPAAAVKEQQHRKRSLGVGCKDAHRNLVVACVDFVVPYFVGRAQHMRMCCVDHRALEAVAVFLVQQLGVGKRL